MSKWNISVRNIFGYMALAAAVILDLYFLLHRRFTLPGLAFSAAFRLTALIQGVRGRHALEEGRADIALTGLSGRSFLTGAVCWMLCYALSAGIL